MKFDKDTEIEFQKTVKLTAVKHPDIDPDTGRKVISRIIEYRMYENTTSWKKKTPLPEQMTLALRHHDIRPEEWSMYKSLAGRFFSLRSARKRSAAAAAKRNELTLKKALPTEPAASDIDVVLKGNQYTWAFPKQ